MANTPRHAPQQPAMSSNAAFSRQTRQWGIESMTSRRQSIRSSRCLKAASQTQGPWNTAHMNAHQHSVMQTYVRGCPCPAARLLLHVAAFPQHGMAVGTLCKGTTSRRQNKTYQQPIRCCKASSKARAHGTRPAGTTSGISHANIRRRGCAPQHGCSAACHKVRPWAATHRPAHIRVAHRIARPERLPQH
jgi:hypothetical protein